MDPWCAGYQATMWRDLGTDCGPSRLPSAFALDERQQPTMADGEGGSETGDRAPELPENFVSPLPDPGQLPGPLPELPLEGLPPADDPFPVRPVPSTPFDETSPTQDPQDDLPPVAPDVFPESRPGAAKTPAPKTPAPKTPVAVPENIDDLFTPPSTDPPNTKVPSTLPPAKTPVTPLPNLDDEPAPNRSEALPKPAPKSTLPLNETPSLEDSPDLFPEDKTKPAAPKENGPEPKVPNLFDDSSRQPRLQTPTSRAYVKFGNVLPTSAVQETTWQVQPAGVTLEYQAELYAPRRVAEPPPATLRFMQP